MGISSFVYYVIGVNIVAFLLMRIDKQKAIKQQYRIPERTFWLLSLLGGTIGTMTAMQLFRHKTKHPSFYIGMPVLLVLQICFLFYFLFLS
ncbi:DUF1294 domain-containing protein [Virgibacillus sp. W0430]|uniref:DUF1294 domain-containing protein n=1 Tax=Virgibacillus sp. W0430 TaxID=3391580 RepID=UPI003F483423